MYPEEPFSSVPVIEKYALPGLHASMTLSRTYFCMAVKVTNYF